VTDTHTGTVLPGVMHRIPITGTAVGSSAMAVVRLLVGGVRCYLPMFTAD
jgi:hypothetical protein